MPFKPIKTGKNKGKFRSPGGRIMSRTQVIGYYKSRGGRRQRTRG